MKQLFLPLLLMAIISCNNGDNREITQLRSQIDSLNQAIVQRQTQIENLKRQTILPDYQIKRLKQLGLEDPINDLVKDVYGKPEIIDKNGVLGGNMVISEVDILNGKWAYAKYEDGHIMGSMLLEYTVKNGKIVWTIIKSELD